MNSKQTPPRRELMKIQLAYCKGELWHEKPVYTCSRIGGTSPLLQAVSENSFDDATNIMLRGLAEVEELYVLREMRIPVIVTSRCNESEVPASFDDLYRAGRFLKKRGLVVRVDNGGIIITL